MLNPLRAGLQDGSIKFWDAVGNQVVNTLSKAGDVRIDPRKAPN